MRRIWLTLVAALLLAPPLLAQEWRTEPLSPLDQNFMESQLTRIDELAMRHLNRTLAHDRSDLALLQALLDKGVVARDDSATLQAMGVVLGEQLKREHGLLWTVYIDKLGRSRALEVPGTREFLFPITMISRRYEVGGDVDVAAIYERASGIIAEIRRRAEFR
jgi:hypothetical protein